MAILRHCKVQSLKQKRLLHSVYNVSPNSRCQEQQNQACYLTKTVLKDGLPAKFVNIPSVERENIIEAVKRCVIETNYFHRDEELILPKRWSPPRKAWNMELFRSGLSIQVLLNMLKIMWSTESARDFVGSNTLTYRTDLVAPWLRLGNKIQVSGKHGHLISGKSLLPLFAGEKEINESCDEVISWSDVLSPFFDLHEVSAYYEANRGFYADSPFPCPQTLMIINPRNWKARFNSGQGVFYSFAHAMTYALSQGEEMGKDLVNPVPMQCIVFNGCSFYFICYQLNTLNFSDDNHGVKNIAWIVSDQRLYDQVTDKSSESLDFIEYKSTRVSLVDFNRKKVTDRFNDEKTIKVSIEGFNRNTVGTFIDFLLRPCTKDDR